MNEYLVEKIEGGCLKRDVEALLKEKTQVGCKLISVFPDNLGGTIFIFYQENITA